MTHPITLKVDRLIERRYITIAEAAEYLGVTTRTVYQMIADGRMKAYKSGQRLIRLRIDEVDDAMQLYGGSVS